MPDPKLPQAPSHLAPETRRWWRSVVENYELEEHHRKLLTLAGEAWDRACQARRLIADEGPVFHDRFGQPRRHPAVGIEEQCRVQFARILRELDLDGDPHPDVRPPRRGIVRGTVR